MRAFPSFPLIESLILSAVCGFSALLYWSFVGMSLDSFALLEFNLERSGMSMDVQEHCKNGCVCQDQRPKSSILIRRKRYWELERLFRNELIFDYFQFQHEARQEQNLNSNDESQWHVLAQDFELLEFTSSQSQIDAPWTLIGDTIVSRCYSTPMSCINPWRMVQHGLISIPKSKASGWVSSIHGQCLLQGISRRARNFVLRHSTKSISISWMVVSVNLYFVAWQSI